MEKAESLPENHVPAAAPDQYLRRFDLLLGRFFEVSLDLLCIASFDGYFKTLNPAWSTVLGFSEAELLARPYIEFVHPDDRGATGDEADNLNQGSAVLSFENRYIARDGSHHWLAWNAMPEADEGLIYAIARDVSDQKHRQQIGTARSEITRHLSRSEDWAGALEFALSTVIANLNWSRAELWVPDDERLRLERVISAAPTGADASGPEAAVPAWWVERNSSLCGKAWDTGGPVLVEDVVANGDFLRTEMDRPGDPRGAVAFPILKQGQVIAVLAFFSSNTRPLDMAALENLADIGVQLGDHRLRLDAEDASRLAEQLARASLEYRASHDSLTGLANRELALDRLERAVSAARRLGRRLAVMMLDLDNFKTINDVHGHAAGDDVLKEASARLTASLREADTVARLGGDEFVVIAFLGDSPESVTGLSDRVRAAFGELFVAVPKLDVKASVGIALFPDDATDATTLLGAADSAMYAAKVRGIDFAQYEKSMPPGRAGSL